MKKTLLTLASICIGLSSYASEVKTAPDYNGIAIHSGGVHGTINSWGNIPALRNQKERSHGQSYEITTVGYKITGKAFYRSILDDVEGLTIIEPQILLGEKAYYIRGGYGSEEYVCKAFGLRPQTEVTKDNFFDVPEGEQTIVLKDGLVQNILDDVFAFKVLVCVP